jgi:hypothetical protein
MGRGGRAVRKAARNILSAYISYTYDKARGLLAGANGSLERINAGLKTKHDVKVAGGDGRQSLSFTLRNKIRRPTR